MRSRIEVQNVAEKSLLGTPPVIYVSGRFGNIPETPNVHSGDGFVRGIAQRDWSGLLHLPQDRDSVEILCSFSVEKQEGNIK